MFDDLNKTTRFDSTKKVLYSLSRNTNAPDEESLLEEAAVGIVFKGRVLEQDTQGPEPWQCHFWTNKPMEIS